MMAGRGRGRLGVGVLQTGGVSFHPELVGLQAGPHHLSPTSKPLFSAAAAGLAKSLIPASILPVFLCAAIGRQFDPASLFHYAAGTAGRDVYGDAAGGLLAAFCLVAD